MTLVYVINAPRICLVINKIRPYGVFCFYIVVGPGLDIRLLIHYVHKYLSAQLDCFCSRKEQKHVSARSIPTRAKQFALCPPHIQTKTVQASCTVFVYCCGGASTLEPDITCIGRNEVLTYR